MTEQAHTTGTAVHPFALLCVFLLLAASPVLPVSLRCSAGLSDSDTCRERNRSTDVLPMLSYDSNTGVGFGIKSCFLDHLGQNESFDAVIFGSSKEERWVRLVISLPDFERRQGKPYPAAVDLAVDYDLQPSYSFFGTGNRSSYDDRLYYKREAMDCSMTAAEGFTASMVGQAGIHLRSVRNSGFPPDKNIPGADDGVYRFASLLFRFRYDTRTSYINPSQGVVLQGEVEQSIAETGDSPFRRYGGWIQAYTSAMNERIIFAGRGGIQGLSADNVPQQNLLPVGGGSTVRGYAQDRYLDRISAVLNLEMRFPIYWRFSGAAGYDAGKVWNSIAVMDLNRWAVNPVIGLRFSFDTFITRLDVGISSEETAFYLNFGQLF